MGKISSTKRTPLRDKFWFFENYWKCIRNLRDEIKLEVLTAIIERSFYGVEPDLSDEAEDAFSIMRIGIDTSLKNYQCKVKGLSTKANSRRASNQAIQPNKEFDNNDAIENI